MVDYKISLDGLDELTDRISEIGRLEEAKQILKTSTENEARNSQYLVPVGWGKRYPVKSKAPRGYRGGTLKRSMAVHLNGLSGEVCYGTEYAAYQEYGTRFIPGRKFLGSAFISEQTKFINQLKRLSR